MTISYICIVISLFIPLACAYYAKFSTKGYDNKLPREFLAKQKGVSQRANHAQQNFYETFPAFAVGVVAAHQMNAPQNCIAAIAITYIIARILYAVCYIMDNHIMRTLTWTVSFIAIISLYFSGLK